MLGRGFVNNFVLMNVSVVRKKKQSYKSEIKVSSSSFNKQQ